MTGLHRLQTLCRLTDNDAQGGKKYESWLSSVGSQVASPVGNRNLASKEEYKKLLHHSYFFKLAWLLKLAQRKSSPQSHRVESKPSSPPMLDRTTGIQNEEVPKEARILLGYY